MAINPSQIEMIKAVVGSFRSLNARMAVECSISNSLLLIVGMYSGESFDEYIIKS